MEPHIELHSETTYGGDSELMNLQIYLRGYTPTGLASRLRQLAYWVDEGLLNPGLSAIAAEQLPEPSQGAVQSPDFGADSGWRISWKWEEV